MILQKTKFYYEELGKPILLHAFSIIASANLRRLLFSDHVTLEENASKNEF